MLFQRNAVHEGLCLKLTLSGWVQECTWAFAGPGQDSSVFALLTYIEKKTVLNILHLCSFLNY
jgi:hypothetical protein